MTPDLLLVGLSLLTWGLGEGMFFFFNPLYLQQLGADPVAIGAIYGAAGLAMTVAHIPAGYLSDRIGRKPMLVFAWGCGVLAALMMALAPGLGMFVAGLLAYSLTAFVVSPLNSYVTGARGRFTPGRAMTLSSAFYNVGSIAGPLIGGWIGNIYGLKSTYEVAAGIFVVSTIILLFAHAQPRELREPGASIAGFMTDRRYLAFMGVAFVVMFATFLPQPLTANFLQNERGLSLSQIGLLGSISSFGVVVLNLGLGQLNARLGFILGQLAVAFFALFLWQGTGMVWYALGYFLMAGFRVIRPLTSAQVRELIHGSQMGLAYGITETINAIPIILAPLLAGIIYQMDPVLVYPVSLGLILVGIALSYFFAPRHLAPLPAAVMATDAPLHETPISGPD
jgi:DHA1 family tetracycline resistance protein-like MFS transporter